MNFKLLISIVCILLGSYWVLHGLSLAHPIEPERNVSEKIADFFTNNPTWNPLIEFFGGTPIKEPEQHTLQGQIEIFIGSVIGLAGLVLGFFYLKKMKSR